MCPLAANGRVNPKALAGTWRAAEFTNLEASRSRLRVEASFRSDRDYEWSRSRLDVAQTATNEHHWLASPVLISFAAGARRKVPRVYFAERSSVVVRGSGRETARASRLG